MTRARAAVGLVLVLSVMSGPADAAPTPVWLPTHPVQSGYLHQVAALPGGTAWAVVDGDRALRSTDFGRTWTPVAVGGEIPLGGGTVQVTPVSPAVAYAAIGVELFRTEDAGSTWDDVDVPAVSRTELGAFTEALRHTGGRLWVSREPIEPNGETCPTQNSTTPLLSTSNGRAWQRRDIPFPEGGVDVISFRDARNGVALVAEYHYEEPEQDGNSCLLIGISDHSGVYVTSDGGKVWRRTFECDFHCNGAAWVDSRRVVIGRADGSIFVSADSGRHFVGAATLAGPVSTPLDALDGLDCIGERCFASMVGGGVFRSDNGGTEWDAEVSDKSTAAAAHGTLSMFDAEHAVAFGATSIITREQLPTATQLRAHEGGRRVAVRVGQHTWRLPDGTRQRVLRTTPFAGR